MRENGICVQCNATNKCLKEFFPVRNEMKDKREDLSVQFAIFIAFLVIIVIIIINNNYLSFNICLFHTHSLMNES
jgi:uncharacterized integral membrane protein